MDPLSSIEVIIRLLGLFFTGLDYPVPDICDFDLLQGPSSAFMGGCLTA